jgi:hypothetical protein
MKKTRLPVLIINGQLIIGECKTRAKDLTVKEVENLVGIEGRNGKFSVRLIKKKGTKLEQTKIVPFSRLLL